MNNIEKKIGLAAIFMAREKKEKASAVNILAGFLFHQIYNFFQVRLATNCAKCI